MKVELKLITAEEERDVVDYNHADLCLECRDELNDMVLKFINKESVV